MGPTNFGTRVAVGGGGRKLTALCAVWCVSGIGLYPAVHRVPQSPSFYVLPDGGDFSPSWRTIRVYGSFSPWTR